MSVRPFSPLAASHPAVTAKTRCRLCDEPFLVGERPFLLPAARTDDEHIVEAALAHWTCHLATQKPYLSNTSETDVELEAEQTRLVGKEVRHVGDVADRGTCIEVYRYNGSTRFIEARINYPDGIGLYAAANVVVIDDATEKPTTCRAMHHGPDGLAFRTHQEYLAHRCMPLNGEASRTDLARQTDDERIGDQEDEADRGRR